MNDATIERLNRINREFYATTAASFDESRDKPWPGWDRLLPFLRPPLSVLDVGCGNGRLGIFFTERLGGAVTYHGVDSSAELLQRAERALRGTDARLEQRDIVEYPPAEGEYDLVALFGVLHHVPGMARRRDLVRTLAGRVAPGGHLAFAAWRFWEFERFRARIIPWPEGWQIEPHDYLLDWQRGTPALRYCHYIDDAEHAALIAASQLAEVASYRADGKTGDMNYYSVLRRVVEPKSL